MTVAELFRTERKFIRDVIGYEWGKWVRWGVTVDELESDFWLHMVRYGHRDLRCVRNVRGWLMLRVRREVRQSMLAYVGWVRNYRPRAGYRGGRRRVAGIVERYGLPLSDLPADSVADWGSVETSRYCWRVRAVDDPGDVVAAKEQVQLALAAVPRWQHGRYGKVCRLLSEWSAA